MKKALPYSLFAIIFHGACIALLTCSPANKPSTKLVPFKEKIVTLSEPCPSIATLTTTLPQPTLKEHTDKRDIEQSPHKQNLKPPVEKKKTEDIKKTRVPNKPIEKPKPKPKGENQPTASKSIGKEAKLKAIADLTKTLSKHLDESNVRLADITFPTNKQLSVQTTLATTQDEELCQLLREYMILPFSGEVRLKLVLTPQGLIQECVLLSEISESEKALILMRIHAIPFKKFLDKYKISKNIVFHIKLLSNES
ncbi:inclusion-associated protein [Chlamydia buteonis]|uniref:Inclusion-associated protein n=1 Tax=Chlamydia buteonis TaxID=2494525 RepID=A0ABX8L9C9_9CHLA|nr:inclusion-associated protein [Chlamydia buteonis]QXE26686.1 inclusion-associated protein [Chlamydia buteonis]QXE27524.1 inclusion-associated protein [Chlamydia buteonis]